MWADIYASVDGRRVRREVDAYTDGRGCGADGVVGGVDDRLAVVDRRAGVGDGGRRAVVAAAAHARLRHLGDVLGDPSAARHTAFRKRYVSAQLSTDCILLEFHVIVSI